MGQTVELIEADLRQTLEMFQVLSHGAGVGGVHHIEIRFRSDGETDTIIVGYGEQGEPAIIGIEPWAHLGTTER